MSDQEMFDGQEIVGYIASIPSMKLEAPDSYQRGTYLTLQTEVRVRSVRYEEVVTGKQKGELVKVHVLAVEDVKILGVLTPQERLALLEAQVAEAQAEIDATVVDGEVVVPELTTGSKVEPGEEDTWEYAGPEGVTEPEEDVEPQVRSEVTAGF